jgi:hypothetical protein
MREFIDVELAEAITKVGGKAPDHERGKA